jgi:hypothetical protein
VGGRRKRTKNSGKLRVELLARLTRERPKKKKRRKAKQSKAKQNKTKSWSATSSPYNSLSRVTVHHKKKQQQPPVRAEKSLRFFRQIAFSRLCVPYNQDFNPHFLHHSFQKNSCHQLFVCLLVSFGVGFCPWDPSPGRS